MAKFIEKDCYLGRLDEFTPLPPLPNCTFPPPPAVVNPQTQLYPEWLLQTPQNPIFPEIDIPDWQAAIDDLYKKFNDFQIPDFQTNLADLEFKFANILCTITTKITNSIATMAQAAGVEVCLPPPADTGGTATEVLQDCINNLNYTLETLETQVTDEIVVPSYECPEVPPRPSDYSDFNLFDSGSDSGSFGSSGSYDSGTSGSHWSYGSEGSEDSGNSGNSYGSGEHSETSEGSGTSDDHLHTSGSEDSGSGTDKCVSVEIKCCDKVIRDCVPQSNVDEWYANVKAQCITWEGDNIPGAPIPPGAVVCDMMIECFCCGLTIGPVSPLEGGAAYAELQAHMMSVHMANCECQGEFFAAGPHCYDSDDSGSEHHGLCRYTVTGVSVECEPISEYTARVKITNVSIAAITEDGIFEHPDSYCNSKIGDSVTVSWTPKTATVACGKETYVNVTVSFNDSLNESVKELENRQQRVAVNCPCESDTDSGRGSYSDSYSDYVSYSDSYSDYDSYSDSYSDEPSEYPSAPPSDPYYGSDDPPRPRMAMRTTAAAEAEPVISPMDPDNLTDIGNTGDVDLIPA